MKHYVETRCSRHDGKLVVERYKADTELQARMCFVKWIMEAFSKTDVFAEYKLPEEHEKVIFSFKNDFGEDIDVVRCEYPDYLPIKSGLFIFD